MIANLTPEEQRQYAVLFNDITYAPREGNPFLFSERRVLADHLWEQGWRREVRPEDINDRTYEGLEVT